jgi:hypothetical protein
MVNLSRIGLFGIAGLLGCGNDPLPPQPSPLIALTPTEYNLSISDLLGFPKNGNAWPDAPEILERLSPSAGERAGLFGVYLNEVEPWPWSFPPENGVNDFDGMEDGQEPSAYRTEELQKAAVHFAAFTLVSPTFFTCSDWTTRSKADQEQCGWFSLKRFANRAWRKPLNEEETTRLRTFWESNWADGTADEAVVLTAAGILQSPGFLYRVETGLLDQSDDGAVPLSDWEMASRLSYFLWDTMPDEQLFAAAAAGELTTLEGVRDQAQRMLAHAKARDAVVRFHRQWLGTDDVHLIAPARSAYGPGFGLDPDPDLDTTGDGDWPAIMGPIRHSMDAEFQLFVEQVIFEENGGLKTLFTDNRGFYSQETEAIYGDDFTPDLETSPVSWPYSIIINSGPSAGKLSLYRATFNPDERAGILTLPAVLAIGAYPIHPSPIHRGKRILERITCRELGAPPPSAESAAPPDTSEVESTNRQRTEESTSPSACAPCHDAINPSGFAFENYDSLGRWRSTDNELPVDATGSFTLPNGENFSFDNGVELAGLLAESPRVRACYALHWARYATGVSFDEEEDALQTIQESFQQNDGILDLLMSIATSDVFRHLWTEDSP